MAKSGGERTLSRVACGMTEHIALRFDWEDIAHSTVIDVLGKNARRMSDGSANWEAVAICTDDKSILLSVEPDTDQIEVVLSEKPSGTGWARIASFSFAIGLPLGWCWVGRNYRGYKDTFTLAFGDVVPSVLQPRCTFVAEASSLVCYDLAPREA